MTPVILKRTSLDFLYNNPFGKLFLNEEKYSLWSRFQDPYKINPNIVTLAEGAVDTTIRSVSDSPSSSSSQSSGSNSTSGSSSELDSENSLLSGPAVASGLMDDPVRAAYIRSVPGAKLYNRKLLMQGYFVSPLLLLKLEQFNVRDDDVYIASYPRSGEFLIEILCRMSS